MGSDNETPPVGIFPCVFFLPVSSLSLHSTTWEQTLILQDASSPRIHVWPRRIPGVRPRVAESSSALAVPAGPHCSEVIALTRIEECLSSIFLRMPSCFSPLSVIEIKGRFDNCSSINIRVT